jgi:hypothetical protein
MKTYLDNVVESGRIRGDIEPPEEMAAIQTLVKADEDRLLRDRADVGLPRTPISLPLFTFFLRTHRGINLIARDLGPEGDLKQWR